MNWLKAIFKKQQQDYEEPLTRNQFDNKYRDYDKVIIKDWAKANLKNPEAPSIPEQITTFIGKRTQRRIIIVKINEPDTFGLVAD